MSQILVVTSTDKGGLDWDICNDLSIFAGKTVTTLNISLGIGLNDVPIDNLALEPMASVPEPSAALLGGLGVLGLLRRRRGSAL